MGRSKQRWNNNNNRKRPHPNNNNNTHHQQKQKNSTNRQPFNPYVTSSGIPLLIKEYPLKTDPGSPSRLFHKSYTVTTPRSTSTSEITETTTVTDENIPSDNESLFYNEIIKHDDDESIKTNNKTSSSPPPPPSSTEEVLIPYTQIIHTHVNGLCILTAGIHLPSITTTTSRISSFKFLLSTSSIPSGKNKKKAQRNAIRSGGLIRPSTNVAMITYECGKKVVLKGCLCGTIVELNRRLEDKPELLERDVLMEGYLAIMMPTTMGFPPPMMKEEGGEGGGGGVAKMAEGGDDDATMGETAVVSNNVGGTDVAVDDKKEKEDGGSGEAVHSSK